MLDKWDFSFQKVKDLNNLIPSIDNYKTKDGKATAYICEGHACQPPITNLSEFKEKLLD